MKKILVLFFAVAAATPLAHSMEQIDNKTYLEIIDELPEEHRCYVWAILQNQDDNDREDIVEIFGAILEPRDHGDPQARGRHLGRTIRKCCRTLRRIRQNFSRFFRRC